MSEQQLVSIILPVFNQADHIKDIVNDYLSGLENIKFPFEIILVVNASRDDSLEACQELARLHPSLRVLHNAEAGWGRAVKTGLAAAQGRVIAYANSARTTPYSLVSLILLAIANPECMIKASRRLRYPPFRRIGSGLYNLQCRALFNLAVWDVNGTPKVFSRELINSLELTENGDLFDLEFIAKCIKNGCQVLDVPIVHSARHGGGSTTNIVSAFKMYRGAFRLWRQLKRRSFP
jgi:glycosyltransferase involved in cell wall biosynthesis